MQIKLFSALSCCFVFLAACQSPAVQNGTPPARSGPGVYQIGQATVYALQDVERSMPTDIFSGASAEEIKKLAPSGSVPSSISAFLIKLGDQLVLVDSGLGQSDKEPKSTLLDKLRQEDFQPEQVTHVLLTHLHGDHVGGLAWGGKAAFPNAQVLVGEKEKNFWLDPETLKKNPNRKGNIELIQRNFALYGGKIKTFAFDQEVLPGIKALAAIGHTPGHTAFMLESAKRKMLFWGDLVHGAALQFPNPQISANFDMDAQQAVATRRNFMEMALARGAFPATVADLATPIAGAHLPDSAVGEVRREKDGSFSYMGILSINVNRQ